MITGFDAIASHLVAQASKEAVTFLFEALKRENNELLKSRSKSTAALQSKPLRGSFDGVEHLAVGAIRQHVADVLRWGGTVFVADSNKTKIVGKIYVDLDTYLIPLSRQVTKAERNQVRPLLSALQADTGHCAILGAPGAGKTTSLKKLCVDFKASGKFLRTHNFPMLIRLRQMAASDSVQPIYSKLLEILKVGVSFPLDQAGLTNQIQSTIVADTINHYLDSLGAVLLLDGFDEIPSERLKDQVERDIEYLTQGLRVARVIVTSRSADLQKRLGSLFKFEIAPLEEPQIQLFAERWLGNKRDAADLLLKLHGSPFKDQAIRPLTMSYLCAIYERTGNVPDQPKSVYRRVVRFLLEDWDTARGVRRSTAYAGFETDRKGDFLAHLAYELTTRFGATRFSTYDLRACYAAIHQDHNLPAKEAGKVVGEIESHTGLIVSSGFDHYEFAHLSLQEYLAADHIVRLPDLLPTLQYVHALPNELAIAIALSSNPSEYLAKLVLNTLKEKNLSANWWTTFAARLILEKPALQLRPNALGAISVLLAVSKLNYPEAFLNRFSTIIPPSAVRLSAEYYSMPQHVGDTTVLNRTKAHPEYRLPLKIVLPSKIFADLSRS